MSRNDLGIGLFSRSEVRYLFTHRMALGFNYMTIASLLADLGSVSQLRQSVLLVRC